MSISTPIYCAVVGNPIAHSRSPDIHHLFAQQFGLDLHYQRILADANDFKEQVQGFFAQGGTGLNITVPFKEKAFELAKHLSPRAQCAGAVNTLWHQDHQLHGCNTDGAGLLHDLRRLGFDPKHKRVLLIGAGGAAKGVLLPLLEAQPSCLHLINRTANKAQQLIQQAQHYVPHTTTALQAGDLHATAGTWDIVINATSSGLEQRSPLTQALQFSPQSLAYDMVYGDQATAFMQQSHTQGATHTADGLGMLVGQAAMSFEIWHGLTPDSAAVLHALRPTA